MSPGETVSKFRIQKVRVGATVRLLNGEIATGFFFVADGSPHHEGRELVGELLNGETGLLPFERTDTGKPHTVLYNRSSVITVALSEAEGRRVSGYDMATRRIVSILLTNDIRVVGAVCIYRPEGRDRLSDWARESSAFRYVETDDGTLLVNAAHIVELSETEERPRS